MPTPAVVEAAMAADAAHSVTSKTDKEKSVALFIIDPSQKELTRFQNGIFSKESQDIF